MSAVFSRRISVYFICSLAFLLLFGCEYVEKPEKNSGGQLSLKVAESMDAPPYHKPLDEWSARHMDLLKKGFVILKTGEPQKIEESQCYTCHYEPDKFCNNCHRYVGVKLVHKEEKKD